MTQPQKGVLLVNLGSPDSPSVKDVRRYLDEFLMDERVIDVPLPIRRMIVKLFILPFRSKQSAHAYQSIWRDDGSPLIVLSQRLQAKLQDRLDFPVSLAMRYGNPSIESGLKQLLDQGVTDIFLIPLYPQYAMSTVETCVVLAQDVLKRLNPNVKLDVSRPFYNDRGYVDALVASAKPYLQDDYDHLLFSYHGLPERHLRKTDPTGRHCLQTENCCRVASRAHVFCYRHQCYETTNAFGARGNIPADKYSISFQSRLGRDPWLTPFTDHEIERLASDGVKTLRVICPAFVSDCLETLEEIGMRGKEVFLEHGGKDFQMIPCLNDHDQWAETLAAWCLMAN